MDHATARLILGVPGTASDREVRSAWRDASMAVHPDQNKHPAAERLFKVVTAARDSLLAPEVRSETVADQQRRREEIFEEAIRDLLGVIQQAANDRSALLGSFVTGLLSSIKPDDLLHRFAKRGSK